MASGSITFTSGSSLGTYDVKISNFTKIVVDGVVVYEQKDMRTLSNISKGKRFKRSVGPIYTKLNVGGLHYRDDYEVLYQGFDTELFEVLK